MSRRRLPRVARVSLLLFAALALTACGSSAATPAATPQPTPAATSTPAATDTPTAAPSAAPTTAPAATPSPTASPAPTATSAPTASPSPTAPAVDCTGTATARALYDEAAAKLPFDVYCAVLPSDYWAEMASYVRPEGGMAMFGYENARGFQILMVEGQLCKTSCDFFGPPSTTPNVVPPPITKIGRIWFGDIGADLYDLSLLPALPAPPLTHVWVAIADMGQGRAYIMEGLGMSMRTFVKLAKAVHKIPKP